MDDTFSNEINVIDWQAIDFNLTINSQKKKRFIARAFGMSDDGESYCLQIKDFKPYFYIQINEIIGNKVIEVTNKLSQIYINDILDELLNYINKYEDCYINDNDNEEEIEKKYLLLKETIFKEEFANRAKIKKKKYDYFRDDEKETFVKLSFYTKRAFNLYKRLLKKVSEGNIFKFDNKIYSFELYETNIEPLIRLFHVCKIMPSGWIKFSGIEVKDYKCSQNNIKQIDCSYLDISKIESMKIAPFKIASFDIECTSQDENFPQPNRLGDKIIQIGITTHIQGENKPYEHYMITLGPCDNLDENTNKENKKLVICEKEADILIEFARYIREDLNPDIITGYNIWGFDWMYMYKRAELLDSLPEEHEDSSYNLLNEFCKMSRIKYESCRYVEKSLSSSALGDNLLRYMNITGRVQIDLLKLVQKDYNLSSYKLNAVSANFLKGNVEIIENENIKTEEDRYNYPIHQIKSKSIDGIYVNNQISFVDQFENKVDNGYKFTVTDLDHKNKIITLKENLFIYFSRHCDEVNEEMKSQNLKFDKNEIKYNWCENKIDLPAKEIFKNFKIRSEKSMREIGIYCIKDCILCNSLMIKLDVIIKNIGMSNVCSVPLSYLFMRGQGIKIFSVISQQCQEDDFVIPVITKDTIGNTTSYEGAIVLNPKIGIYFEPVAVMDYSSLYPSSMISENISHDSLVIVTIVDNESNIINKYGSGVDNPKLLTLNDRYIYKNIEYNNYDENKEIIGKTICTYVQSVNPDEKSVLPRVLKKLLQARKDTRKTQKNYSKDDFVWDILEGLQLAYKVTCNSLYGATGASTSPVCKIELAASTTAFGRRLLEVYARDMILDKYEGSECVYGDTDSVFIKFNTSDLSEAIRLGKEAGELVTKRLIKENRQPHDLEYEKTFYPFILFSKKRYIGNKYEEDIKKYVQTSMGIVLKRRDNAKILKSIYQGVINTILNEKGDKDTIIKKAYEFYKISIDRLLNGEIKFSSLEISKTLKGNYKNPTQQAHKVLADRMRDRDPGNAPAINDRIPYVYINEMTIPCSHCNKTKSDCNRSKEEWKLEKCTKCLKLFCNQKNGIEKLKFKDFSINEFLSCIDSHKCKIVCRFCHIKLDDNVEPCKTCEGYFCEKCVHTCLNKLTKNLLQGDKIEHPDYLIDNPDIEPDYKYYFEHQIEKPIQQIFDLTTYKDEVKEYVDIKFNRIKKGKKEHKNMINFHTFFKKV